jgi:pyruvate dehydrogenase E1 component beta subunit
VASQIYETAFDDLDAPIQRVASVDVPMPYNRHLEAAALPSAEKVVEAVDRIVS